jgi:hypothetical protein
MEQAVTAGLDRCVTISIAVSDGQTFDFSTVQKSLLAQSQATKKVGSCC